MRKQIERSEGIEQSLLERVMALPSVKEKRMRSWTNEEDEALIAGMRARKPLKDIAKVLGVCDSVARDRYRYLIDQKKV